MTIAPEKVVGLRFDLHVSNGTTERRLMESANEANPFYFLVGNSGLPFEFENALIGLEVGKNFDFTVNMIDAYGPMEPEAVMDIPNAVFTDQSGKFDSENVNFFTVEIPCKHRVFFKISSYYNVCSSRAKES